MGERTSLLAMAFVRVTFSVVLGPGTIPGGVASRAAGVVLRMLIAGRVAGLPSAIGLRPVFLPVRVVVCVALAVSAVVVARRVVRYGIARGCRRLGSRLGLGMRRLLMGLRVGFLTRSGRCYDWSAIRRSGGGDDRSGIRRRGRCDRGSRIRRCLLTALLLAAPLMRPSGIRRCFTDRGSDLSALCRAVYSRLDALNTR